MRQRPIKKAHKCALTFWRSWACVVEVCLVVWNSMFVGVWGPDVPQLCKIQQIICYLGATFFNFMGYLDKENSRLA